ncbi:Quinone oxidoreductase 1 [Candidatus Cyrtobacter comes]|uniref:Quinone oxidoreductase 1 n=1 Tax=Candidatus Cyrtobacter comes TaxID=675776 RepID=A0ABU5L6G1_9RICK|nr:zinc-binding dehydrogenase [Candidatus Cyrtobacter comes]MDZ5761708.1 Quinone oxidoreductase 1 [Candidatus Cyrtobacter comes]
MYEAVFFSNSGDSSVLFLEKTEDIKPKEDEVLLRQVAIGVNDIDILYRSGAFILSKGKNPIGFEAAGIIEEVGNNVSGFNIGDKVVYATGPLGAYCSKRCISSRYIIKLPKEIDEITAASVFFKALSAHYLLFRAFLIREGFTILVHDVANPLNQILVQWACINKDVRVIGTVANDEHRQMALSIGCSHVMNYNSENWDKELIDYTSGTGVKAVYDLVGRITFAKSIKVLSRLGLLISYGRGTGSIGKIDFEQIFRKSIFITSPSIFDYKNNRMELILSASEVFALLGHDKVKIPAIEQYQLADVQKAHQSIEAGNSNSIVLV